MPAIRTRKSSISSKVTLYEPIVASTSSTSNDVATSLLSTPLRRSTRSMTASSPIVQQPLFEPTSSGEEEEEEKPIIDVKKEKTKSPRKPTPRKTSLATPHPPPKNWEKQYSIIERQRKEIVAPVDLMGCEQGGRDPSSIEPVSRKDKKLSTLVSLMLSSQTKDEVTDFATKQLRKGLPGGLTIEGLEAASIELIDSLIKKVGFHNTKAVNLKKMAIKVKEEHGGEVPEDLDKLLEFVGVGPKMAFLAMSSYGHNIGIGVDTHVHRITHRLRWHRKEPKNPEETRLNLESWLPQERWPKINKMLVGFGQEICRPVGPRCDQCHLGEARLCPSRRTVVTPLRKKMKIELKEEEVLMKNEGEQGEGKPKVEIGIEEVENVITSSELTIKNEDTERQVRVKKEVVEALVKVED